MENLDPIQQQTFQFLLEEFHDNSQHDWIRWITMLLYSEHQLGERAYRLPNIERERGRGHDRLMRDCFLPNPVYTPQMFRRRFRIRKPLFERVLTIVTNCNPYFTQRYDAVRVLGLSPVQKVTAAIRMLAYDKSTDELDEYLRVAESTGLRCLKEFCKSVISEFGVEYLRAPTVDDMQRILQQNASRGFPGMLGSLDCMHWEWKNCPRSWAGQFQGKSKRRSIILEAISTYDLWVWHAFFGVSGSHNDINVLDRSPLFTDLLRGVAPAVNFTINNHTHHMAYFLTDGIYPNWPVFVQSISNPLTKKWKLFAKMQEGCRKDVERCFGVLQLRWAILKNPYRLWKRSTLHNVVVALIILHNMIVEDERGMMMSLMPEWENEVNVEVQRGPRRDFRLPRMMLNRRAMTNEAGFHLLHNNLIEHIWSHAGQAV